VKHSDNFNSTFHNREIMDIYGPFIPQTVQPVWIILDAPFIRSCTATNY